MRTLTHPRWQRNGVYLGAAIAAAALSLVVFAAPALAHANIIVGTSSCPTIVGADYQISWSISNDWNLPETGYVTYATGGSSTLSVTSFSIPASGNGSGGTGQLPYQSVTVTQTLPHTVVGTIYLNVRSTYSDNYRVANSGQITAPTNCPAAVPTTTIPAAAPAGPATAALVSPTTVPAPAPNVAATTTTTTIPASPPATNLKIANSVNGAKRPTLLASSLPPAKPQTPVIKAASFTG